ncbi:GNAT family N-acetyltransferase [Streptomyces griseoluteus]|uniref:GNAT family N-acetyltransferase n=1 Tax=Streptomyces griseoluteus TaxID=29306 RepID=UPI0036FCF3D8
MPVIRNIVQADHSVVEELLYSNRLGDGRFYDPEGLDVVVAELHGSVVGVAEFQLHCDFGHSEGREAHPGEQTFISAMAVALTGRRGGVGRALLTEIARRAQKAGDTFLALVPQNQPRLAQDAIREGPCRRCTEHGLAPVAAEFPALTSRRPWRGPWHCGGPLAARRPSPPRGVSPCNRDRRPASGLGRGASGRSHRGRGSAR